jgi:rifampicin phosphotransferase
MPDVLSLAHCVDAPVSEIGGKAAGLADLARFGHQVPDGFVVTTRAYRTSIHQAGLDQQIARILESGDAISHAGRLSSEIRALFESFAVPEELAVQIADSYNQLGDGRAAVAVRSSATAEDTAEASFAGQQETYLWVSGERDVLRHVARCWSSLFTPQAIAYRSRLDVELDDLDMAVVVQQMVAADSAGVMMTLEPVDGDQSVVYIESAYGLGEGVVRGDVGVDRFWVDKSTMRVRRREVTDKEHAHRFDPDAGEVRLVPVPADRVDQPSLSHDEVADLAELAIGIEVDFGAPMDIEWAVSGPTDSRSIHLLQARRETVWSQRAASEAAATQVTTDVWSTVGEDWDPLHNAGDPDLHWSTDNIGEGLPGVLTPLGWSLWKHSVDHASRESAYAVGALARKETAAPSEERLLVQVFYGRAAMQTEFYAMLGDRMPGTTGEASVKGVLGHVPPDMTFSPSKRRYPAIAWRLPRVLLTASKKARTLAIETDRWWHASLARVPRLSVDQARVLLDEARRYFGDNQVMQGVVTFGVVSPLYEAVSSLVAKTGVGDVASLSGTGGAEIAIIGDIWRASRGEISLEEVLANHGCHGPAEGEASSVVWREDPATLKRLITEYAERDDSEDPRLRVAEAQRRLPELQNELVASLPAIQRPIVRRLLRMAVKGIPMRGVSKRGFVQSVDVVRAAARRMGDLLVEEGVLRKRDDIFYLTLDELQSPLIDNVQELVDRRAERRDLYKTVTVPAMWKGNPQPVPLDAGSVAAAGDQLNGIGVSAGVVEGIVRVVEDPTFAEVLPDEVLVAATTDPSWSAIMFISSALVVDIGGALSHAAVVARELGFPCVVGTRVGTKVLRTGDRVRVDGRLGIVHILKRAADKPAMPTSNSNQSVTTFTEVR